MDKSIDNIWIETQELIDYFNYNSDVIFEVNGSSKWIATFFTYKNIETLHKKNQLTGECLTGTYFCATNIILISEIFEKVIRAVLEEMLSKNELEIYWSKITE